MRHLEKEKIVFEKKSQAGTDRTDGGGAEICEHLP